MCCVHSISFVYFFLFAVVCETGRNWRRKKTHTHTHINNCFVVMLFFLSTVTAIFQIQCYTHTCDFYLTQLIGPNERGAKKNKRHPMRPATNIADKHTLNVHVYIIIVIVICCCCFFVVFAWRSINVPVYPKNVLECWSERR